MTKPPLIVKATDICANCGDEFANHNYVPESLTVYKCRVPHQECGYGMFTGGPDAKFYPDDPPGGPGVWVVESEQFFEPLEPSEYEPDEEDYE